MTALFAKDCKPEPLYRIDLPRDDGSRKFVAFVRERWVPAWEAIGCVATPMPETPEVNPWRT